MVTMAHTLWVFLFSAWNRTLLVHNTPITMDTRMHFAWYQPFLYVPGVRRPPIFQNNCIQYNADETSKIYKCTQGEQFQQTKHETITNDNSAGKADH
jgi:hypothetical protein